MGTTAIHYRTLTGGELVDAASEETMEVMAPATGVKIAEVPRCVAGDADRAVEAAKQALPDWLEETPKERSELLHALADVLDEQAEELSRSSLRTSASLRREPIGTARMCGFSRAGALLAGDG